jgi:hypothetical protein
MTLKAGPIAPEIKSVAELLGVVEDNSDRKVNLILGLFVGYDESKQVAYNCSKLVSITHDIFQSNSEAINSFLLTAEESDSGEVVFLISGSPDLWQHFHLDAQVFLSLSS